MRHSFSVSDRGRQSFAARSTSVMRSLFSEPLADSRLLADGSPGRLASTSTSCIRARRHRRPAPARTIGAADMLGVGHVADLVKEAQLVTVICAFTIVRKEAAIIQIVGRAGLWSSGPLRQGSWGSFSVSLDFYRGSSTKPKYVGPISSSMQSFLAYNRKYPIYRS